MSLWKNLGKRFKKNIWFNILEAYPDNKIILKLKEESKEHNLMTLVANKKDLLVNVFKVSEDKNEYVTTDDKVPRHIVDNCMAIVTERRELLAALAEAENTEDAEDYTSLCGDNQYEEIQEESKYGLWGIKESLLRVSFHLNLVPLLYIYSQELKRDLCKLMRVDKAYSEVKKKPKSINVRPGLALGVITLQVETQ